MLVKAQAGAIMNFMQKEIGGVKRFSMKPTEEWLVAINKKFREANIPPKARPFLALKAFSEEFKCNVAFASETANIISDWFYKNTKEGTHKIGSMYRGAYYFDACFWPVDIPIIFGKPKIAAFDSLKSMPEQLKKQIKDDKKQLMSFLSLWMDCIDYAYGYDDIISDPKFKGLALNFIKSADKELRSTVSLLLQDTPEAKAIESARMAVEMFLKAIVIITNNWDESEVKKKINHNLIKAVQEAFNCTHKEEIKEIEKRFQIFPNINERYTGRDWKSQDLWKGYCAAQVVAAIFTRSYSERDIRQQISK